MELRKGIDVHRLSRFFSKDLHPALGPPSFVEGLEVIESCRKGVENVMHQMDVDMEVGQVVIRGDRGSALSICTVLPRG